MLSISENFYWKEDCLRKAGKTEDIIELLKEHIDYVIHWDNKTYDEINEVWYFNQLKPSELKKNICKCERLLNNLKSARYDKLRCDPAFNELIVKLENEVRYK